MKNFGLYAVLAALVAIPAVMTGCDDSDSAVVYSEPTVKFSTEQTSFDLELGETLELSADVQPEGKVYIKWYVNDVLEATTAEFSYEFNKPGKQVVSFSAKNGSGEVTREFTVNVANALDVELSIGDEDEVTIEQFETLTVVALVNKGEEIEHSWKIDGNEVSTERVLERQMTDPGRFKVDYTATNSAGRYDRTFHVEVTERGLYIEMSYTADTWEDWVEEDIEITANVIAGGSTAVHDWKLDGNTVSTDTRFFRRFVKEEEGEHTLVYTCTTDNESFTKSYKIIVWYAILISDFESYEDGLVVNNDPQTLPFLIPGSQNVNWIYKQSDSEKDAINSSDMVLRQYHATNPGTSGITDVYINHIPNYEKARAFRFKYHNCGNNRIVEAKYGVLTEGPDVTVSQGAIPNYDGWQEIVLTLDADRMSGLNGLRIRPLRASGDVSNVALCYIDDLYLCKY